MQVVTGSEVLRNNEHAFSIFKKILILYSEISQAHNI